ncbi:MAG: phenylalanine--tRNA ligase subunit alpha [Lacisediminihabitans sp.]
MSETISITVQAVETAVSAALAAVTAAADLSAFVRARSEHLGETSTLARLNASLREVPAADKAAMGKLVGQARGQVNQAFATRESELRAAEERSRLSAETVDVTAVASLWTPGARHPLTLLMEQIGDIFIGMGWEIAEGPELENEWFNFDALNFDEDHPARAMQDTFFVDPGPAERVPNDAPASGGNAEGMESHLVLRTHTSPVQIRSLLTRELPVYVIAPGKVYRTDELDATHTPVFHQVEGIAIDKGLTMAHLRGTLEHFARLMFGDEAKIRLRPNYFPFTEPSAEMDVWQPNAKGGARWVEWGGCGMVNRNVLRAAGIDPDEFQGFAFGMGIERTLQFRNDLNDMRDIVEGDIRFSQQFGMVV